MNNSNITAPLAHASAGASDDLANLAYELFDLVAVLEAASCQVLQMRADGQMSDDRGANLGRVISLASGLAEDVGGRLLEVDARRAAARGQA